MTHNQESQVGVSRNGIKPPTMLIGKWNNTNYHRVENQAKTVELLHFYHRYFNGETCDTPCQNGSSDYVSNPKWQSIYIYIEKNTWKHGKLSPLTQSLKTSSFTSHDFQPSP